MIHATKRTIVRTVIMLTSFFLLLSGVSRSFASIYLGWADQFVSFDVIREPASGLFRVSPIYGISPGIPRSWSYLGGQGGNAGGRANARERVNFQFSDETATSCFTGTVQLARYRVTPTPAEDSSCAVSGAFVASASYTIDSCQFALTDTFYSNRLQPTLDFAAETIASGTVAYKTVATSTNAVGGSISSTACYKIQWF